MYRTTLGVCVTLAILGVVLASREGNSQHSQPRPGPGRGHARQQERMLQIGLSNVKFTTALYSILAKEEGNMLFSPLSIHSILTMASLGAKGQTKRQLELGLKLDDPEKTKDGYKAVYKVFNGGLRGKPILNVANKIYVNKGASISPEFQANANVSFQSQVEGLDFRSPSNAANTINEWVELQTNHKIKNIVEPGMLGTSAMVLVNAVYFKAQWESVFSPEGTFDKDFKIDPDHAKSVTMMYSKSSFTYQKRPDLKCQLVSLDYGGNEISMVLILPDEDFGMPQLEKELARVGLENVTDPNSFHEFLTTVIIPKFKFDKGMILNNALREMGMTSMFGGSADFSGMTTGNSRATIGNVAHKAFVEVNEEGTEAAGASYGGEPLSVPSPQAYFIADHPFIFLIHHKKSRNIFFIGRYSVPPPQEAAPVPH